MHEVDGMDIFSVMNSLFSSQLIEFVFETIRRSTSKKTIMKTVRNVCMKFLNERQFEYEFDETYLCDNIYTEIVNAIKENKQINMQDILPEMSKKEKEYLLNEIYIELIGTVDLRDYMASSERTIDDISYELDTLKKVVKKLQEDVNKPIKDNIRIKVLFLGANPNGTGILKLDEEARSINEMIRKADHRDALIFESRWAVRTQDILQAINEINPTIIHFSGHGTDSGKLVLLSADGRPKHVSEEALVQTMMTSSDVIRVVFFNTCFSDSQAKAVVKHVDVAIGMNTSIGDLAARTFSSQFYSSLGFGKSIKISFEQAKAALMLEGIKEENTPQLHIKDGLDPNGIVLVNKLPCVPMG